MEKWEGCGSHNKDPNKSTKDTRGPKENQGIDKRLLETITNIVNSLPENMQASNFHGNDVFGSAEVPWTCNLLNWSIGFDKIFCG